MSAHGIWTVVQMASANKNSCCIGIYICVFPAEDEEFPIYYVGPWKERGMEEGRKGYKPKFSFVSHCKQFKSIFAGYSWL